MYQGILLHILYNMELSGSARLSVTWCNQVDQASISTEPGLEIRPVNWGKLLNWIIIIGHTERVWLCASFRMV